MGGWWNRIIGSKRKPGPVSRPQPTPVVRDIPTRPATPNINVPARPVTAAPVPVNVPPPATTPSGPPPEPTYEFEVRPGVFVTLPRRAALSPRIDPARYPEPEWNGNVDVDPMRGELYAQPTFNVVGKGARVYVMAKLKDGKPAAGLRFQFVDGGHLPIVAGATGVPGLWFGDYPDVYPWNDLGGLQTHPELLAMTIRPAEGYSTYASSGVLDSKGEWVGSVSMDGERNASLEVKVNGRVLVGPGDKDSVVWRSQAWFDETGAAATNPQLSLEVFMDLARASAAVQG